VYILQERRVCRRRTSPGREPLELTIIDMPIRLYLPETHYAVASLPLRFYKEVLTAVADAPDFVSVTRDKDEVSLVVAEEFWRQLEPRFPGSQAQLRRRLIVFDTVFDFSVVGFLAEISRALAEVDISILSISTYRTDAVLVHESCFDRAVQAINRALATLHYTHLSQI
jgi:hypothetical protein